MELSQRRQHSYTVYLKQSSYQEQVKNCNCCLFVQCFSYSSVVESGRCSGNLVRRKFEQSTTVASHRHLAGQTGLLLQSLFKRVSSEPETNIKMLSEKHHSSQESINGPLFGLLHIYYF